MSTKTTHVLSKEEIVSRLENLHFSFEEHHWESFQQRFAEVNVQQVTTGTTKFSPKLIAIPACIVLAGIIVYFSVNKLQSQNSAGDTKVNVATATTSPSKSSETKPEPAKATLLPETKTTEIPVTTVANKPVQLPRPTVTPSVQTAAVNTSVPLNTANTAANVPANTAKVSSIPSVQPQGTATPQQQPVKRFYKKKPEAQTIPQQLVPHPDEDNVVVPEADGGTSTSEN